MCPTGIGEVLRRIIGKSVVSLLQKDILHATDATQVCAGHLTACEAAIHALRKAFSTISTDAVLMVDAYNAFNRLNHMVTLHNIQLICSPLATILTNIYHMPTCLFVSGGMELSAAEGTTQGCPLSMAMYALSILPLIDECCNIARDGCASLM